MTAQIKLSETVLAMKFYSLLFNKKLYSQNYVQNYQNSLELGNFNKKSKKDKISITNKIIK